MKKVIPLVISLVAFSLSAVWGQTEMPSASPSASPGMAKHKHAAKARPSGTVAAGGGPGMVWVNTDSQIYHRAGSKWYGRTKNGKYLSEQDAIKEGDHLAKSESKSK